MLFRRAARRDPRTEGWRVLAERLELVPVGVQESTTIGAEIGLDEGRVSSVHALRRSGQPELVVLDVERAVQGTSPYRERHPLMVVRSDRALLPGAWRAFPAAHPLLAKLEAGRAGATAMPSFDAAFDEVVGIVARERRVVDLSMTTEVRAALVALLVGDPPPATLVASERHLLWRAHRQIDPPFVALVTVASRLLTLWAALEGAKRRHDALAETPRPPSR